MASADEPATESTTEIRAKMIVYSVAVDGVLLAAQKSAGLESQRQQTRTYLLVLLRVLRGWRSLADDLPHDSAWRASLWAAIADLERVLGTDEESVNVVVNLINIYVYQLEIARHANTVADIGSIDNLRTAEQWLIELIWLRSESLPDSDERTLLQYYLSHMHAQLQHVETGYIESADFVGAVLSGIGRICLRIALATVTGGSIGALLGISIAGEDWVVETIKGIAPALAAQSVVELNSVRERRVEWKRALDPNEPGNLRDVEPVGEPRASVDRLPLGTRGVPGYGVKPRRRVTPRTGGPVRRQPPWCPPPFNPPSSPGP